MKTLDEVIWAVENCDSAIDDCAHCAYYKEDCENLRPLRADALHYLQEYKTNLEDPDGDHQQLEKAQKLLWEFYQNDPLTWDELKQMEGKPVWVEYGCDFNQKRWVIIGSFHGRKNEFQYMDVSGGYPNTFWEKDMGEDEFWQAYRKER